MFGNMICLSLVDMAINEVVNMCYWQLPKLCLNCKLFHLLAVFQNCSKKCISCLVVKMQMRKENYTNSLIPGGRLYYPTFVM